MTASTLTRTLVGMALSAILSTGCAAAARGGATMNPTAAFDPSQAVEPVTSLLRAYEAALNRADVDAIVALYAPDAVFMAQHRAAAVGRGAIEATYREIFGAIRVDVRFEIDEVVVVSPTVAWARTHSAGKTAILGADVTVTEGNNELFVIVRSGDTGQWQIGRYAFSTNQPRTNG